MLPRPPGAPGGGEGPPPRRERSGPAPAGSPQPRAAVAAAQVAHRSARRGGPAAPIPVSQPTKEGYLVWLLKAEKNRYACCLLAP